MPRTRVVIIGGGFGGLSAAQSLRDVDVVLIDRTNHHLFQPLLYQVATAALSPSDIAWLLWCVVHIFFLIGFRNRVRVMSEWIWYYLTFKPGAGVVYESPRSPWEAPEQSLTSARGNDSKESPLRHGGELGG